MRRVPVFTSVLILLITLAAESDAQLSATNSRVATKFFPPVGMTSGATARLLFTNAGSENLSVRFLFVNALSGSILSSNQVMVPPNNLASFAYVNNSQNRQEVLGVLNIAGPGGRPNSWATFPTSYQLVETDGVMHYPQCNGTNNGDLNRTNVGFGPFQSAVSGRIRLLDFNPSSDPTLVTFTIIGTDTDVDGDGVVTGSIVATQQSVVPPMSGRFLDLKIDGQPGPQHLVGLMTIQANGTKPAGVPSLQVIDMNGRTAAVHAQYCSSD